MGATWFDQVHVAVAVKVHDHDPDHVDGAVAVDARVTVAALVNRNDPLAVIKPVAEHPWYEPGTWATD